MVSRIMKDLRQGGYISIDSKKRIILEKKLPARW
jgi:CRP-like cAMP-binding protein